MNFCGISEGVGTPVGSKSLPQTRPPPSPLMLSITRSEFQTPRSAKGDSLGLSGTPSPALLNPLAHEFWGDMASGRSAPICPRLESSQDNEPFIQRLLGGFRVKIHDGSCPKGRVVEVRLAEDRTGLYVVDDTMAEDPYEAEEKKSPKDEPLDSQLLYRILIEDVARVDVTKTCFSIVTKTAYDGCFQFDFECTSIKQREAVVSALRAVTVNGEKSLRLSRRSLPSFLGHVNVSVTPDAMLSPMQRTCIYPGSGSMEEGTELALSQTKDDGLVGNAVTFHRRKSVPEDPFSFSEFSQMDEHQDVLDTKDSILAASFQEALDEWCSEDACIDLTEVSESLKGMFYILGNQKLIGANNEDNNGNHVRADSSDMQDAALCVADFLNTPASIWADLPSPIGSEEKLDSSTSSRRKLRNRACVASAQAHRWRKLQTEMTFEAIDRTNKCLLPTIATTKSLDDLDGTEARVASSRRIASRNFTDTSGYGLFELFPVDLWADDTVGLAEHEEYVYYDSDPECSRAHARNKGPRRIQAEWLNNSAATEKKKSQRLNFSIPRYVGSRFDDEYASAIVDIMKSEQLPLLWHPASPKVRPNRSPVCVTAWIERGTYLLTQAFVQPKFMWRPAHEMNLESRRLNVASESPERVDLLEIARVQDSPTIDRKKYPFANKRCFLIETQSEIHLFEAQTLQDKKRIVFGLKLVIARLASLIMVRDTKAVEEFFEPVQVPGEAPVFARY